MYLYKVNSKEHGFCCCMFSTKIFRCCPLHFVLTVCAVLQPGSWLGQLSLPGGQLGERGHEHSSHLLGHQVQPTWRQYQASTYSTAPQPPPGTPSPASRTSAPGKYLLIASAIFFCQWRFQVISLWGAGIVPLPGTNSLAYLALKL